MSVDIVRAYQLFTPGAPIQNKSFFAGRIDQIGRVVSSIPSPGIHPIIFGLRGVGKTSLANVIGDLLPTYLAIKITCDAADTFYSIWDKVLRQASISFKEQAFGFNQNEAEQTTSLASFLNDVKDPSPSDVASIFSTIKTQAIFVLDEFDRVTNEQAKEYLADLIKNVSDNLNQITIVIVGVGTSVSDLIEAHESVSRNLRQIELPPMEPDEIRDIISRGMGEIGITFDDWLMDEIVLLCDGFPHYAHLLGLAIARACDTDSVTHVSNHTFDRACASAVSDAIETLKEGFSQATSTAKPSNYPRILVGCGYAHHDDRGVFRATDVVNAVADFFGDDLSVPRVVPALSAFASRDRGPVLQTISVAGRNQYRFVDPMMRPFLKIKGRSMRPSDGVK